MALILNIDTAVETASACLAKNGHVMGVSINEKQHDHARWLHPAMKELMENAGMELPLLDAVAITEGPGSYTGLRIGMAAAKGICYALNKPLITLNTLLVMANAAKKFHNGLLCPMIDARRMEVFTAIYTPEMEVIKPPAAIVLDETSFKEELDKNQIFFFGNGSIKFRDKTNNPNAVFGNITMDASAMAELAEIKFSKGDFANLAYSEPLYLKEFYTPAR
jgi:tRNA threonylcarbamoyladenosine biosynthesis protein TsaB